MSLDKNRSLTILEVKDFLGKALKDNMTSFDQLSKKDDQLHKQMSGNFGSIATMAKRASVAILAIGTAAAAGLGAAIKQAEDFNGQFRELANLNLDKSGTELAKLRKNVLDASYDTGRSTESINKAFFDIQSGTGKFGDEVETAARKASDFARAYQIDFNTTVDGAVKGMKAFNIEADNLDSFFGSMVKTVQVGIVTFEDLARVQTNYAGAANTAGQSVDSANKLFAVFSAKAKSAEEAATLTKSAFTDLLKPATLKTFGDLGIKVFDETTGKVKQLDEIVGQLNDTFASVKGDDEAMTGLINQFSGGEGLIALIGTAAKNGDEMMNTFKAFDNTKFSLGKALEKAGADTSVMAEIARSRLAVIMTEIGDQVLPLWLDALERINDDVLPAIRDKMPAIRDFLKDMGDALIKTVKDISWGIDKIGQAIEGVRKFGAKYDPIKKRENREALVNAGMDEEFAKRISAESAYEIKKYMHDLETDEGLFDPKVVEKLSEALSDNNDDIANNFMAMLKQQTAEQQQIAKSSEQIAKFAEQQGVPKEEEKTRIRSRAGQIDQESASAFRGVQGAAAQNRNITVTIQRLIGIENLNTTNMHEAPQRVAEAIKEALVRSIRDAEVGIN